MSCLLMSMRGKGESNRLSSTPPPQNPRHDSHWKVIACTLSIDRLCFYNFSARKEKDRGREEGSTKKVGVGYVTNFIYTKYNFSLVPAARPAPLALSEENEWLSSRISDRPDMCHLYYCLIQKGENNNGATYTPNVQQSKSHQGRFYLQLRLAFNFHESWELGSC